MTAESRAGGQRREGGTGVDPDLAFLRAAVADRAAFAVLYRRYLERVYGYAFYLLGDHHDAEDVTERTFLAALAAVGRFRDEGATVRAWLFRIAHNEIANALRARGRHQAESLDGVAAPAATDDPELAAVAGEDARRVRAALGELSEDRRQVLILRFVDELSAREVGVVLGRTEGAVRVLQHRALRELAARLEPRPQAPGV